MNKQLHTDICNKTLFSKIYEKYAQSLTDFLYYQYGEILNPSDKAQDAFIKLWENCQKIAPNKAKSFLFTTANNMMLNATKHQKVVLKYKSIKPIDYTNEDPEFILRKEEFMKQYQQALARLTVEQRTAFLLNKVEGKKHSEIAEMLGVTNKVVEYRIYRAFNILKTQLDGFKLK